MSLINDLLERVALIQTEIANPEAPRPYVFQTNAYTPSSIMSANLPMFVNEVTGGYSDLPISDGQQRLDVGIDMHLCVTRSEANLDLSLDIRTVSSWVESVFSTFAKHTRLSNPINNEYDLTFVVDAVIRRWEIETFDRFETPMSAIKFQLYIQTLYVTTIEQ